MKQIEVHGLEELQMRMQQFPLEYTKTMAKTTVTAMLVLQEQLGKPQFRYPPKPTGSSYDRTGTLGRSIGITESGARIGTPSIWKVRRVGGYNFQGHFGTNLNYAPRVIGSRGQQSEFFAQYWWRLEQIIGPSYRKIVQVYEAAAAWMARVLEGRA